MLYDLHEGVLIVVDGPSGSGKDSLLDALLVELHTLGLPIFCFSEEEVDEKRGEILEARRLGKERGGTGDIEMANALIEHRHEVYQRIVEPRVKSGEMVFANRGEVATLAYQTVGGELTMEEIWNRHRGRGIRVPNLVILTICSAEIAEQRLGKDRIVSATRREKEASRTLSGKITEEKGTNEAEKMERRRKIHHQYREAVGFLKEKGVPTLILNTETMSIEGEIKKVVSYMGLK